MRPSDLLIEKELRFVDTFGFLPLLHQICFDPNTRSWDPPNILLTGHKGTGKSLLLAYLAKQNQTPYLSLDCSEETRERHIKGGFVASGGSTPFVLGTVANAIQVANECGYAMLVLEEINALSPQRQKELNPVLDFRRKIEIPELSTRLELKPGAKLFIAATMNPSSPYGGTYELNEDLKSRFVELDVPYPPAAAEKRILLEMAPEARGFDNGPLDSLVRIAQEMRQGATGYALSPRDLVQIASLLPRVGWEGSLSLLVQKFAPEDRPLVRERIADITKQAVIPDLS